MMPLFYIENDIQSGAFASVLTDYRIKYTANQTRGNKDRYDKT